jgi:hypothetical protein
VLRDERMGQQQTMHKLMEGIRGAHAEFTAAWAKAKAAALKVKPPRNASDWDAILHANGIAYREAATLAGHRDELIAKLFHKHLVPLHQAFIDGDRQAIGAILDFLEIDVPAFRCGYAKEWYLRKMKALSLNESHAARLRQYALRLCAMPLHRREIAELGRLMIKAADKSFIEELRVLISTGGDRTRKKSSKMLAVVLNGRKDLRA